MTTQLSAKTEEITPEIAAMYLTEYRYEVETPGGSQYRQRRLKKDTVKYYADLMRQGDFDPEATAIQIGFVKGSEKGYLLNGQHRLHAIIESGMSQPTLIRYRNFETLEALANAYTAIDRGVGRTSADTFSAIGLIDRFEWSAKLLNKASGAVRFILGGFVGTGAKVPDRTLITALEQYEEAVNRFEDCTAGVNKLRRPDLLRSSVLSVILVTLRYNSDTNDFWHGYATLAGLSEKDSRLMLYEQVGRRAAGVSSSMNSRKALTPNNEQCRIAAAAYNDWRVGKTRATPYTVDVKQPIVIAGTPYDGKNNPT